MQRKKMLVVFSPICKICKVFEELQGFKLLESFFAVVAVVDGSAKGRAERSFHFSMSAVTTRALGMFQNFKVGEDMA